MPLHDRLHQKGTEALRKEKARESEWQSVVEKRLTGFSGTAPAAPATPSAPPQPPRPGGPPSVSSVSTACERLYKVCPVVMMVVVM